MKTLYIACALPSVQLIGLCCTRQDGLWGKNIRLFLWYVRCFLRDVRHFLKNVRCFFKYVCCFLQDKQHYAQRIITSMRLHSVANNKRVRKYKPHGSLPLSRTRVRARIVQEFYAFCFHICHKQPKTLKLRVLPCDRLHFNETSTVTPSFFSVW